MMGRRRQTRSDPTSSLSSSSSSSLLQAVERVVLLLLLLTATLLENPHHEVSASDASASASASASSGEQVVDVEVTASGEQVVGADDGGTVATKTKTKTTLELLNELVSWVDSLEGGYWNPKQTFQPQQQSAGGGGSIGSENEGGEGEPPTGTGTSYGIFAKEFIPKDTLLLQVPFTHILDDEESAEETKAEFKDDDDDGALKCGTVRNLAAEMKKNPQDSKFRPYIEYLSSQPRGQIPSDYTLGGQKMVLEILGGLAPRSGNLQTGGRKVEQSLPPVDPVSWIEDDWYEGCAGTKRGDQLGAHAAVQVIQRSDDEWMIPLYDVYNHRNGQYFNTRSSTVEKESRQIYARRDILRGEEIFNSYNLCDHCGGRKDGYGTPEIFRDYGFVEDFPQRWDLEDDFDIKFDLLEEEVGGDGEGDDVDGNNKTKKKGSIKLIWIEKPENDEDVEETKRSLRKELRRLYKVRHMIYSDAAKLESPTGGIPLHEWTSIWNFHQAIVNALSYAINGLADGDAKQMVPVDDQSSSSSSDATPGVCSIESCGGDHFHSLKDEPDDIKYNKATCNNREIMRFPDYWMFEHMKTHYQILNFAFREEDGDICMDLEDTLQICSSYRPHYHEYSEHFAARFIDNVKRIIFIGGGDSMLLHESLKFPNLEKVVGLELDQVVTRKSFKYFRTRPHFDDERVEWWFGDATKSLLLLPEDYWGTFDLVLVDLSETVMAFSVTEHLDVFSALALLLNKEGVMVKNELYMNEMSEVFDYTASIHIDDNPKICSQAMAFGSNSADFFRQKQKDHMVETLALPPVSEYEDRFDYFHDYRMNNAMDQGKCNLNQTSEKLNEQTKSAGILHVLDIEGISSSLAPKDVEGKIISVAKDMGLSLVSVPPVNRPDDGLGVVLVVLKEGYVLARLWPDEKYIGLDVGMWGGFDKASAFQRRLGREFEPTTLSSFRVVVGGMYGSSTWETDRDIIGPQIVQRRNCDEATYTDDVFSDVVTQRMVVDEVVNLVASKEIIASVFCGVKGQDECLSVDVLKKNPKIDRIIPIWTCPSIADLKQDDDDDDSNGPGAERIGKMISCEQSTIDALEDELQQRTTIDLLVLDGSAPLVTAQILNSILAVPRYRDEFLSPYHFMMTWSTNPKNVQYQRYVFEQYRKDSLHDPISRAEVKVEVERGSGAMEVGLLSVGDLAIFHNLYIFEKKLSKRINKRRSTTATSSSSSSGGDSQPLAATVETRNVMGGLYRYSHQWEPKETSHEAYDHGPGDVQYSTQKPMGREVIVQLELNPDAPPPPPSTASGKDDDDDSSSSTTSMPTWKELTGFMESTLDKMQVAGSSGEDQNKIPRFESYSGIGDGGICMFAFKTGSVVLVWDGRNHVDVNLFFDDELKELADSLISMFVTKSNDRLMVTLRDDFPRGTGRVINFQSDMDEYTDIPSFLERYTMKTYVGGDEEDENDD